MKLSKKIIGIDIFLIVFCLVSFFGLSRLSTSKTVNSRSIKILDEKQDNVMRLTAVSAGASFAISLIPGDVGESISDKLADLSGYFIAITIGIYIEKWMIAIMGIVAFKVIVPIGCIALIILTFLDRPDLNRLTLKVMIYSIVLTLIVPCSTWISQTIDTVSDQTISERVEDLQKKSDEVVDETKDSDNKGLLGKVSDIWSKFTGGLKGLLTRFETLLRNLIDTIAAMFVTSCVIPVLIFVFLICVTNMIFGKVLKVPDPREHKLSDVTHKIRESVSAEE